MNERPEIRYLPHHCAFLEEEVWAILVKQADGRWKIVNCLDKDSRCFPHGCAFTTDGGAWPFEQPWVNDAPPSQHGAHS